MTDTLEGIKRDGDYLVFRVHKSKIHPMRCAFTPIRAGETVSDSTQAVRDEIVRALGKAQTLWDM